MFIVPKLWKMLVDFIHVKKSLSLGDVAGDNISFGSEKKPRDEKDFDVRDFLKKYIYLSDDENGWISKYCARNYLVYILTIDSEPKNEAKHVASISNNGSYTSFKSSSRRRSPDSDKDRNKSLSIKASKSKIPVIKSKSPTGPRKLHTSLMDLAKVVRKDSSSDNKASKGYEFIKKFMGFQKTKPSTSGMEELFVRELNYLSKDKCDTNHSSKYSVPTTFVNHNCIVSEYSVETAMREMMDVSVKLRESELHVKDMIARYIQDTNVQQDLASMVCGHGKLLLDSERRALNLASDTWLQQAEIYKEQHKNLQTALNSIVTQNRELQTENDLLQKKNEKLSIKVSWMDEGVGAIKTSAHERALDEMSRSNNKLRNKLSIMTARLSDFEQSLRKMQKRNDFMQQQLTNSNAQLQNSKARYDRATGDHDLEMAKLVYELQTNSLTIKESMEAGDVLMDDLDCLKSQVKSISKCINWEKFGKRGKSLTDLIHLSRACINELARELIAKESSLQNCTRDTEQLKEENVKYSIVIQDLHEDKEKLQKIIMESKENEIHFRSSIDKCEELDAKLADMDKLLDKKNGEIAYKEDTIRDFQKQVESLSNMLSDKTTQCANFENKIERLEQERNNLLVQVNGVAQVLSATGAGEIAKELATTQEKLAQLQEQYFAAVADKNYLINQMDQYNTERQTLMAYQKDYYDKLQLQQKEMETLERSLDSIKEQLDTEKQTVLALQTDRVRHLEERSILTAIYERLKAEISKVDQLEGAVNTMNKKASRLAMIAEYNKQLGEKLQSEVAERDVTINRLQNDVKDLNNYQLETTKEKAALCEELTQVCGVKEILNTKLACEVERNMILGESKKEIENVATIQLREMQSLYQKEHNSLKILLKEVKSMAAERDSLIKENKENHIKLEKQEKEKEALIGTFGDFQMAIDVKEKKIRELVSELASCNKHFDSMKSDIENEVMFYKQSCDELRASIESLKSENANLKKSVSYQQTNVKKLTEDYNEAKEIEKNLKEMIKEEEEEKENLQQSLKEKLQHFDQIKEEHDKVKGKLMELSDNYKHLHEEYQKVSNEAIRFEKILHEKFSTEKNESMSSTNDTFEEISARDEEILTLQEKLREFEQREVQLKIMFDSLNKERDTVNKERNNLVRDLEVETLKTYEYEQKILSLETDLRENDKAMATIRGLEEQNQFYKQNIDSIKNEYDNAVKHLHGDIFDLTTKLSSSTSEGQAMTEAKNKLEKAHKEMAIKLLRAAQVLISEKVARQNAAAGMKRLEEENDKLKKEIQNKEFCISKLKDEIDEKTSAVIKLRAESEHLASVITSAEEKYKRVEEQMCSLNMQAAIRNIEDTHDEAEIHAKLDETEARYTAMKAELEHSHKEITRLQEDLSNLESKCACMEFQKCEAVLRLHELQGKMQTEKICHEEMKVSTQNTLAVILEMRENGTITQPACASLLSSIQNCMHP